MKKSAQELKNMANDELIVHCLDRLSEHMDYPIGNGVDQEELDNLIDEINSRKRKHGVGWGLLTND